MHPAECGIDPIQIMVQALARPHLQALGLPVRRDRERPAGLDHRQYTHQPFRHSVPLGNLPRFLRAARAMRAGTRQVLDRPPGRRRNRSDMVPDPLRLEEPAGVLERNTPSPQVPPEGSRREEPVEVSLEDHPVKCVDRSRD